ncbi:hypothetical protein [Streptomyces sp. NPDC059256]|uniref:hypothetical protein n=1 Tax=Streptomyces sp. NPDC059256 TaxID=3346794 RepID=UPI0036C67177
MPPILKTTVGRRILITEDTAPGRRLGVNPSALRANWARTPMDPNHHGSAARRPQGAMTVHAPASTA